VINVTLQDAGLYMCEGFNMFGRQLTTGQLTVQPGLFSAYLTTTATSVLCANADGKRTRNWHVKNFAASCCEYMTDTLVPRES